LQRSPTSPRVLGVALACLYFGLTSISGCLETVTEEKSLQIDSLRTQDNDSATVNVCDEYPDYRDKIKRVDRVGVSTSVYNGSGDSVDVSLFFQGLNDTTPVILIESLSVPAEVRQITYEESVGLLLHFERLQCAILEGPVTFTARATGAKVITLRPIIVTITFTVSVL
jgi:hypothetical protein